MKCARLLQIGSTTKDERVTGSRGEDGENRLKAFRMSAEAGSHSGSVLLQKGTCSWRRGLVLVLSVGMITEGPTPKKSLGHFLSGFPFPGQLPARRTTQLFDRLDLICRSVWSGSVGSVTSTLRQAVPNRRHLVVYFVHAFSK